ncbi:MAG: hypothetical protein A2887_01490 [Alphaproteobacteria bacterium RIFCSPLOWO2_01_FULL_40_26]|nr:MAG: hypothetical protein A3D15_04170 [Alphaproteobacteria bacterium RIFCSPHIGHO2_02_FULL_40_34]OFW88310.1 MAG: hypothetical protein A2794_04840 [Alphaproteobacteria bacterium RIFCSPHIGHO2_01_FULL_40_8]OFW94957.1 MAG: hypothetical protein A2887_01490 [Alphaproteobacteria bacterium RIFCSPLOWO2_01_FULL_40_26]OFX09896.1 MAG: hypothetical protein A3H30_06100 [Alphaproteobacteria bacterium RIFCSPLOWO2_02_FULL_40_19]OFX10783.1 MAG: hypothetical protein A3G22_01670 [Alphaproteobacteria bacterium RI
MIKTIELIVIITLLIFAFFAGVKYSDSVKSHASWLFETRDEEEVELPDLSNENNVEIIAPGNEDTEIFNGNGQEIPMDNIEADQNSQPQQPQAIPANPR